MLNLMPLLPKPSGGKRCVAKTVLWYRLWCLMRRPVVKKWENEVVLPCDVARPGSSAITGALSRALSAELACVFQHHACAALWDNQKLFDTVRPGLFVPVACALDYPLLGLVFGMHVHLHRWALQMAKCCAVPMLVVSSVLAGCSQNILVRARSCIKK